MSERTLREDIEFLAGRLPHRGGNTENERIAAEYLYTRLRGACPQAEIDDFYAIESFGFLFASYYWEFLFVAVISVWWPAVAAVYGLAVFVFYLAEFTGYPVLSRLLPQFETQNVVGRFHSLDPQRLVIVTAHYDSARATLLSNPAWTPYVRLGHVAVVFAMVLVVTGCVVSAMGTMQPALGFPLERVLIWIGAAALTLAGIGLYTTDLRGSYVRGAVNNASGAAALLDLADRLQNALPKTTDVWLVATGSKEAWLGGMHHLLRRIDIDREHSYFINLAHVGAGELKYITGEGMLHRFKSAPELVRLAESIGPEFGAEGVVHRGLPTDALIPLTRGFKTLGIMGADAHGRPPYWNWHTDTVSKVDYDVLERSVGLVETLIRRLDDSGAAPEPSTGGHT